MKRVIGIVLLVLALLGAWGVVRNWSKPSPSRSFGRSSAYESGRKAGKYMAPVVVVVFALGGLYLLSSSNARPKDRPSVSSGQGGPWHKTKSGKVILITAGGAFALVLCAIALTVFTRFLNRRPSGPPPPLSTFSRPESGPRAVPGGLTRTGPYEIGTEVKAEWAGGVIPGQITRINPGGFNVMVQLNDRRFPHPIILSTNALRLR